jgi:hypothetical protein
MKLGILAESPNDEAAIRSICESILQCPIEIIPRTSRSGGITTLTAALPVVIREFQFSSDALGLIVLADSNHTSLIPDSPKNRREQLLSTAERTLRGFSQGTGRARLRVTVAIAAPAIEAWLLSPRRDDINEAAWEKGIASNDYPYSKQQLKVWLHGAERGEAGPRLQTILTAAAKAATQITKLRAQFPNGFGKFHDDLLSWKRIN